MRRTGINRGTKQLTRKQGLRVRASKKVRRQPPVVTLKTPEKKLGRGLDPKLRKLVYRRSGGACDFCGRPMKESTFQAHHRKLKSQGGPDSAENLLALHDRCHHEFVHHRPTWSKDHGFIVPSWADPVVTPIFRHCRRWQQPTAEGWVKASPIETGDGDGAAQIDGSALDGGVRVSGHAETRRDDFSAFEGEAS